MSRLLALYTVLLLAALALGAPLQALAAESGGREFNGSVMRAGEGSMDVENRMGDKLRFHRTKETAVEGRPSWKALAKGDRVIVEYRVEKGGRNRATRVIVLHAGGK